LLGPSIGPSVAPECEGHVSRWLSVFNACCCAKMHKSRRGHVTWSLFKTGVSCQWEVGAGVELGTSRVVAGMWGVVPVAGGP
jgi:hypothetical protein